MTRDAAVTSVAAALWGNALGRLQHARGCVNTANVHRAIGALEPMLAATAALTALVAEVAQKCIASASPADETMCGAPARWGDGHLTAWTCSKHRRPTDKNAIGGPALQAAFDVLEAIEAKCGAAGPPMAGPFGPEETTSAEGISGCPTHPTPCTCGPALAEQADGSVKHLHGCPEVDAGNRDLAVLEAYRRGRGGP